MLNQVVLVGRITNNLELKEENEKALVKITIAIPRNFKNSNGEYDSDLVECYTLGNTARNTAEYCKKGYLIGIKGRIESLDGNMRILAEKISFLAQAKA
jgi:single-strand DNA-binding protein